MDEPHHTRLPAHAYFDDTIRDVLGDVPGVQSVDLRIVWEPPWHPDMMSLQAKGQLGWLR